MSSGDRVFAVRVWQRAGLALALLLAACTPGEGAAPVTTIAPPTEEPSATAPAAPAPEEPSEDQTLATTAPAEHATPAAGSMSALTDANLEEIAAEWIAADSGLPEDAVAQLQPTGVTRSAGAIGHVAFAQVLDGTPVRGATYVVHIQPSGAVLGASTSLSQARPAAGAARTLDEAAAVEVATGAVPGEVEGTPRARVLWIEVGDELRLAWEVDFTIRDPLASYGVVVDAADGEVLSVDSMGSSRGASAVATLPRPAGGAADCDPGPAPSACVFPVDPIAATGDFAITVDEANATLVAVPLERLDDPASGRLAGQWARLAPGDLEAFAEADGTWGTGGRATPGFEAGMAYYWVDFTQALVQRLGYGFHGDDPVEIVPVDDSIVDNAFYTFVEDRIHLGVGSNGISEGEDAQGVVHEYGHALLQAAVPDITSVEGGAFHEGFADLVSFLTTLEYRAEDPACLFPWAEEGQCLRRVDEAKVYPDDLAFEVHLDGEILTGAVYDVLVAVLDADGLTIADCAGVEENPCGDARDVVLSTLLGSLPFLTSQLTLNDAATAFATADTAIFGGANAGAITAAFTAHGLVTDGTPAIRIEGIANEDPTDAALGVKVRHDYRGDLAIRFEVTDAAGEQLCAGLVVDPDPADDADNITGRYQLAGTECEQYLPPGDDQRWTLIVADTLPQDEGELRQYTILHSGTAFRATGLPLDIPDADGQGIRVTIGGPAPPGPTPPPGGGSSAEGLTAGIAISHPYIGDLQVTVGVADAGSGEILCSVVVHETGTGSSDDDIRGIADVGDCTAFYPPTPEQPWFLQAADLVRQDEGTIDAFGLRGPDGEELLANGPVPIPDDDPTGAILLLEG